MKRYRFPFDGKEIPTDGIYLLFEEGETAHEISLSEITTSDRIVRVGTHTGAGQLPSRLRQHFVLENKDRSVFRKNIGRALLTKAQDPYLTVWELDLTSAAAKKAHMHLVDLIKQIEIEKRVSAYMREAFSFVFVRVDTKEERLSLESKIISTLSRCDECQSSIGWLGNYSPKEKIRESGLWLVNELYKDPLSVADLARLRSL